MYRLQWVQKMLCLFSFVLFVSFISLPSDYPCQTVNSCFETNENSAVVYSLNIVLFSQSLYKAISGHGQPESYKQPAVLSDAQVWIPLGRAVFLEADFRTSEVGDTAMSVFKVRYNPYTYCQFT